MKNYNIYDLFNKIRSNKKSLITARLLVIDKIEELLFYYENHGKSKIPREFLETVRKSITDESYKEKIPVLKKKLDKIHLNALIKAAWYTPEEKRTPDYVPGIIKAIERVASTKEESNIINALHCLMSSYYSEQWRIAWQNRKTNGEKAIDKCHDFAYLKTNEKNQEILSSFYEKLGVKK